MTPTGKGRKIFGPEEFGYGRLGIRVDWGNRRDCKGGVIGTYLSIKNVSGAKERGLMILCAAWIWIGIIVLLTIWMVLRETYLNYIWVAYMTGVPPAIRYANRKQNMIRESEK